MNINSFFSRLTKINAKYIGNNNNTIKNDLAKNHNTNSNSKII